MRLIDADAVIADVKKNNQTNFDKQDWTSRNVCTLLIGAPTIDAVPVVRCRECIHWVGDFPGATKYVKRCEWAGYMVGENGYCVYGERKEEEQDND